MVSGLVTPPPRTEIKTPGAPRLGSFKDDYQPFSPRKSSRISQRSQLNTKTPSPEPISQDANTAPSGMVISHGSPPPSVTKKRVPTTSVAGDGRRVSSALTGERTASAAEALGLTPKKHDDRKTYHSSTTYRNGSMLPTPVKTPQKSPKKESAAINTIARKLFERPASIDDVMPSPKPRKYPSLGLNGYSGIDESEPIQIYTDWSARVPEVDLSPDNPFYGPGMVSHDPVKKPTKGGGKVTVPGEGEITVDEAYKREDGMVYMFRGEKVFRKFTELEKDREAEAARDMADLPLSAGLDATVPVRLRGPTTRSSLKPRLLFPTSEQIETRQKKLQITDDEEVMTDLEDSFPVISTPVKHLNDFEVTPKAPRVAPVSPPSTSRITRNKNMDVDGSGPSSDNATPSTRVTRSNKMDIDNPLSSDPITPPRRATRSNNKTEPVTPENPTTPSPSRSRRGVISPLDDWRRTRTVGPVRTRKRPGDIITRSGGDLTKRRRRDRA